MLGLVVFSIVFGIVLGRMGDRGTPLKALFETLNEVVMKMVAIVMWYVTDKFHEIQFLISSIKVIVFLENYSFIVKMQIHAFEVGLVISFEKTVPIFARLQVVSYFSVKY